MTAPAATGSNAIVGINITGSATTSTFNVFYNTVYLNNTTSGAGFGSSGISTIASATATTSSLNLRNNIIVNTSVQNGAGLTVAYRRSTGTAGTLANYAGTSNNNLFYAGTPGASNLIYSDGTSTAMTLAAYIAGVFTAGTIAPRDGSSVTENPPFLSLVGSNANFLHIDPLVPTQVESGGANIAGITDDYDGNARNATTPDIGADEGPFILADFTAPNISYTALAFTCDGTVNRTLTTTITDASGVPTAGAGLPVLYWRINAGAWNAATATFVSGSTYTFSFGAGAVITDVVQYYVVAQDNAGTPNVGAFPSAGAAGFTINPPAAVTPPTTPSSYTIASILSGTYTVGAAGAYTTLTAAITVYNTSCLGGAVVFELLDATYPTETYPLSINANADASSTNTLTIRPASAVTVVIAGSSAVTMLKLNGADYVTIDGSNNGSTSRNLTITNTSTGSILWIGTDATAGATNNTIKNTNMVGPGAFTGQGIIAGSGTTFGSAAENGRPNSNNTIRNNTAKGVQNAVFASGDPTTLDQNWLITQNDFGSAVVAEKLSFRGMLISGAQNFTISNNTISGVNSSTATSSTMSGIQVSGIINGGTIANNKISNIRQNNTTGWGSNGIFLAATSTSSALNVYNNFIFDVASQGFGGVTFSDNGYGIMIATGGGYNIYHNTVNMNTNQVAAGSITAAINIAAAVTTVGSIDLRNNILSNQQTVGTRYAIYDASTAGATIFSNINYNDYSATNVGFLTSARVTLANWQTATGQDAFSLSIVPNFVSATDLHLAANNCTLDDKGTPIGVVLDDIDADTRSITVPDIGADEFTAYNSGTLAGVAGSGAVCSNKAVVNTGTTYTDATCNLIARVLPSGGAPVTGLINTCVTIDAFVQTYNSAPYLQRHFDIEPATNAATATARVTLYALQSEFDAYNSANGAIADLPTGSGDVAGIASLLVTQYHGTGTAPGNYTGTAQLINPADVDIVWNATNSWWEISFDVTGFSGFYIHTAFGNGPLPITINYFNGTKQGSNHLLNWKVTCNSTPSVTMTLERSANSRNFSGINTITADAVRCNQPFDHTDAQPLSGMNYYRLKMVDANGVISYSNIVALLNAVKGFEIISIAPNPVTNGNLKLNVTSAQALTMSVIITDMQGRMVNRQTIPVIAGYNSIPMNVGNLAAGTYTIQTNIADEKSRVIRFVKH